MFSLLDQLAVRRNKGGFQADPSRDSYPLKKEILNVEIDLPNQKAPQVCERPVQDMQQKTTYEKG